MARPNVNSSGAFRKIERIKREFPILLNYLLTDAPAFFRIKLVNEQLAGAPGTMPTASVGAKTVVGRQTGHLAGSYANIVRMGFLTLIRSTPGVAPYAIDVARTVLGRQGRDYLHVTKFFYEDFIIKKAQEMVKDWLKAVDRGASWSYRNPYPTA
jgi:hypothetical protein